MTGGFLSSQRFRMLQSHKRSQKRGIYQYALAQKQQMERDLYVARQLQQSLLPKTIELCRISEKDRGQNQFSRVHFYSEKAFVTGFYSPCEFLGGDIYDVYPISQDRILFAMCDVSGHGVAASMITAITKAALYRVTQMTQSPSRILEILNNELCRVIQTDDYLTAWVGLYDINNQTLNYATAGHPLPIWYQHHNRKSEKLSEADLILGWIPNQSYSEYQIVLEKGDLLCVYTDGVTDMKNPTGEIYGDDNFIKAIIYAQQCPPLTQLDEIIFNLSDFSQGTPIQDDVSLFLLHVGYTD